MPERSNKAYELQIEMVTCGRREKKKFKLNVDLEPLSGPGVPHVHEVLSLSQVRT
jgi:hypothetical protein